jgi:hypothetical protein
VAGNYPQITEEIVESSKLRAKAVEAAHCMAKYGPVNLQAINFQFAQINERLDGINGHLCGIDNRLDNMDASIVRLTAETCNSRAITHNQARVGKKYRPLQKTVSALVRCSCNSYT